MSSCPLSKLLVMSFSVSNQKFLLRPKVYGVRRILFRSQKWIRRGSRMRAMLHFFASVTTKTFSVSHAFHFEVKNESEISRGSGPRITFLQLGDKDAFSCAPVQGDFVNENARFSLLRNLRALALARFPLQSVMLLCSRTFSREPTGH